MPEIIKMQVVGYELPTANALYAVCIYKKELKNESKEEDPEQPIQINQGAMLATMTQKLKLGKILPEHKSHRATEY